MSKEQIIPHLPPKTCSIYFHESIKFLKLLFVILVVAIMAGASASLAVTAWVLPLPGISQGGGLGNIGFEQQKTQENIISEDVLAKIENASVYIYRQGTLPSQLKIGVDIKTTTTEKVYLKNNAVGRGVFITTDGWLVLPLAVFQNAGGAKAVFFGKSSALSVVRTVTDPLSQYAFVKVAGDSYPVIPIVGDLSWINNGIYLAGSVAKINWKQTDKTKRQDYYKNSSLIYSMPFIESKDLFTGGAVVTKSGELVGLLNSVATDGFAQLLPFALAEPIVSKVFLAESLNRQVLGFKYLFVKDLNWVESEVKLNRLSFGIYVVATDAGGKLAPGDIILSINGIELKNGIDPGVVLYSYADKENIEVKILRSGSEQNLVL